jgi:diguanylate cyclase
VPPNWPTGWRGWPTAWAEGGPTAEVLEDLDTTCAEICRLFAHRHHLVEQVGRLCTELGQGLAELAEDESWARGQAQMLQARLAEGLNARSVRAATVVLAETRTRHARVRGERDAARNALKQLMTRLLAEIGELGEHTGRFHDSVGRHVQAIEAADSLESLAGVVRELVDDSRAVQDLVQPGAVAHGQRPCTRRPAGRPGAGARRRTAPTVRRGVHRRADPGGQPARPDAGLQHRGRAREREGAPPLAVGLIDIDNFKKLNDTLGHAAGDKALQSLAAAVRERLRPVDHLARFGGEEFVVLLPATRWPRRSRR